jgi:hypothetical protein
VTSSPADDGPALPSAAAGTKDSRKDRRRPMTRLVRSKRFTDPVGNEAAVLTPRQAQPAPAPPRPTPATPPEGLTGNRAILTQDLAQRGQQPRNVTGRCPDQHADPPLFASLSHWVAAALDGAEEGDLRARGGRGRQATGTGSGSLM